MQDTSLLDPLAMRSCAFGHGKITIAENGSREIVEREEVRNKEPL